MGGRLDSVAKGVLSDGMAGTSSNSSSTSQPSGDKRNHLQAVKPGGDGREEKEVWIRKDGKSPTALFIGSLLPLTLKIIEYLLERLVVSISTPLPQSVHTGLRTAATPCS